MDYRTLGNSELRVSALGLGCMGMSEFYGEVEEEDAISVIHRAIDIGVTLFDTADMYGPFTNEIIVGKALSSVRHDVVLATKFGILRTEDGSFKGYSGAPEYVKKACDSSLLRLDTDYIDLYYIHRVDPDVPIEETVGAMGELVEAGKVRHIGLSEAAPETIRRGNNEFPVTALQTEYSLWTRDPEDDILPTVRELGIGFVAYSPLGRGFLAGRFESSEDIPEGDYRQKSPRFMGQNFQKNRRLVDRVESLANDKQVTPAQIILAWLLRQGDDIVPIPGTKHINYLEENVNSFRVHLTEDELAVLDEIAPPGIAAGDRYPDMSSVNR